MDSQEETNRYLVLAIVLLLPVAGIIGAECFDYPAVAKIQVFILKAVKGNTAKVGVRGDNTERGVRGGAAEGGVRGDNTKVVSPSGGSSLGMIQPGQAVGVAGFGAVGVMGDTTEEVSPRESAAAGSEAPQRPRFQRKESEWSASRILAGHQPQRTVIYDSFPAPEPPRGPQAPADSANPEAPGAPKAPAAPEEPPAVPLGPGQSLPPGASLPSVAPGPADQAPAPPQMTAVRQHFLKLQHFTLPPVAADPGIRHTVEYEYYTVTGSDMGEISRSIEMNGPGKIKEGGSWVAGLCTSTLGASYSASPSNGACSLTNIKVTLPTTITLPKWDGTDPEIRRRWDPFAADVRGHEESHRAVAVKGANELHRSLTASGPGECRELLATARRLTREAQAQTKVEQDQYHDMVEQQGESRQY